jgi:hypothetical protein
MTKRIVKTSIEKRDAAIAKAATNVAAWRVEQRASMKYVMDVLKAAGFTRITNKRGAMECWDNDAQKHYGISVNWTNTERDAINVTLRLHNDVDAEAVLAALADYNIAATWSASNMSAQATGFEANGVIVAVC